MQKTRFLWYGIPDISHVLMFYWFEPVIYLDPVSKFPETTESPRYFVDFPDNVGDELTSKILKNDLTSIPHRRIVRSEAYATHQNKWVQFKSDVQGTLNKFNIKTGIISKNNHPRNKTE